MEAGKTKLALRIDVDTAAGMRDGVPFMLDALERYDMYATFFITGKECGRGAFLRRWRDPHYRARYRKLGLPKLARFAWRSLCAGGRVMSSCPEVIQRIEQDGHELGLHGFDHGWWADHVWTADARELEEEMERAYLASTEVTMSTLLPWASPAWRTTEHVVKHVQKFGVQYLAEAWGREPFVTVVADGEIPLVHLPITLPGFEGLVFQDGLEPVDAIEAVLDAIGNRPSAAMCMHGYFEGILQRDLFTGFLEGCKSRGLATVTFAHAADRFAGSLDQLPRCRLDRAGIPGYAGQVSVQGEVEHG
jgi:peptidoglycan/xylan/chitin deacetylase (PgdA/CDA1 family)